MGVDQVVAPLEIIIEPDPRFGTVSDRLRQRSEPVEEITDDLRQLADEMHETMCVARGVGLAAPQVGVLKRLIVVHIPAGYHEEDNEEIRLTLVNPEIVKAGGRDTDIEGCLSFPDLVGEVERYSWAIVKGQDAEGNNLRFRAKGILARVIQHEIDHLDGVLFFDRMEDIDDLFYVETPADEPPEEEDEEAPVTA